MKTSYHVMIVEDHPAFVKGLASIFKNHADFDVVGTTGSGLDAIKMADSLHPDLILMDLFLPDISGLQVIEIIHLSDNQIPILVLSNSDDGKNILEAFEKGATGYLSKLCTVDEIISAAKKAVFHENIVSSQIQKELFSELQRQNKSAGKLEGLSSREKEILFLLGEGLSDAEISKKSTIQKGTVRSHVSSILKKLHFDHRSQVIIFAIENKKHLNPDNNSH